MEGYLGFMARVARDILAIPGVNISVERLFSSVKHTLTDARSSMTAEMAPLDIVTKERLKARLVDGINYMDFIKLIHSKPHLNIFKIYLHSQL